MIRSYRDTDLAGLLETWYSASLLAHPFLDEAFFQQERKTIREVHLPKAETWVYEQGEVVVGFIALIPVPVVTSTSVVADEATSARWPSSDYAANRFYPSDVRRVVLRF